MADQRTAIYPKWEVINILTFPKNAAVTTLQRCATYLVTCLIFFQIFFVVQKEISALQGKTNHQKFNKSFLITIHIQWYPDFLMYNIDHDLDA